MSFFEVLGHKRQIDILQRAYFSQRLAHSYIFSGPTGVGKKLLAKAFTKALNCENNIKDGKDGTASPAGEPKMENQSGEPVIEIPAGKPLNDSCGHCHSCETVEAGSHVNFISIEPEKGIIKIEKVRELLKSLSYKVDKGMRVVLIDDADCLNVNAQNALLKTLEEPPANTIIILVTSMMQNFLTTILSRCQRISFGALGEDLIKNYLIEEEGLTPDKASSIARLSDGSFALAFDILDNGLDKKREEYLSQIIDMLGRGSSDVEEIIKESGLLSKDEQLSDFFEVLKSYFRDITILNAGGEEFLHNKDFLQELEREKPFGLSRGARAFSMVEESLYNVTPPRYGNKQLTLEVLLMSLSGAMASARVSTRQQ